MKTVKTRQLRITATYRGKSGSASIPLTVDVERDLDPQEIARTALALLVNAVIKIDEDAP